MSWEEEDWVDEDAVRNRQANEYRELMRMAKCWNHAHSGYLQSFHLEQIAAVPRE
jgi:hypothetical protein